MKTAIANQKGGVGKTTTALNLGSVLALAGRRVLLVDLDPQGNATTGLGLGKEPGRGTACLLGGERDCEPVATGREGLWVLAGTAELQAAEGSLGRDEDRRRFREALDRAASGYDEVILDCPPTLGTLTRTALGWVDRVLVPIQCEFFAMEGLTQILAVIEQVRERENPRLVLEGVLLTMYDPEQPFHGEVVENLRGHLGEKVLRTVIPRDILLAEAASHGVPVVEYDCLSRASFGYVELGKELMDHGREATG